MKKMSVKIRVNCSTRQFASTDRLEMSEKGLMIFDIRQF